MYIPSFPRLLHISLSTHFQELVDYHAVHLCLSLQIPEYGKIPPIYRPRNIKSIYEDTTPLS